MRRHTVRVLSPKNSSKVRLDNGNVSHFDHMHGMAYNIVRVQTRNPGSKLPIRFFDSCKWGEARISSTKDEQALKPR